VLNQPKPEAIQLLDDMLIRTGWSFLINRLDFALDFIVGDYDALDRLDQFIKKRLVKRWHGKQRNIQVKATQYSSYKPWPCHQLVVYPTRRSKITDELCVHVEWRAKGKPRVESLGIFDLQQLIHFDHREFWKKRLCLEEVDWRMLGKQLLGRGRAKKPLMTDFGFGLGCRDADVRAGQIIARAADISGNGATAQDIHDHCRGCSWFRPQASMKRLEITPYLPTCAQ
jgi:hypothetical protein